jgi:cell division septation protein DedD
MSQTDGEKELVLGNKQLISLFFVVVALCGVFFALGYMIGHNTSKPASASLDSAPPPISPAASDVPRSPDSEPPRETAAADTSPAATSVAEPQAPAPVVQTQPVREVPSVPQPGATYLQVTALHRDDADKLVKTLKEQNLPAVVADSSKPDLFRVLVGPYRQTADVADAKARLKSLGFANAFVQK